MENEYLLRWLLLPTKWRWLSLLGLLAGTGGLASYGWIGPAQDEQQRTQEKAQQQQRRYRQLLAPLLQSPALQTVEARNRQLLEEMVREGQPFSLYALLQRSGGELEQWHPDRRDGRLELWLEWAQLKRLFDYLAACRPAPVLISFMVQPRANRLYAAFHLAFDDEIPAD